jgi:phage/plasmid-like protein (TIGR03299 family)
MAHELEFVDGNAQMAYVGDVPWHGLGVKVSADLTPDQMLGVAGLDWSVRKVPAYAEIDGTDIAIGRSALVRSRDNSILDIVSDDWNPVQNEEAFEFFNEFVMAGDMEMHTAGSLKNGQIVWGLAKIKDSFELFKGDRIDSYLLFSNFHKYGFSTDVRFTPIRVVCNNTLTLSLNSKVERMVKVSHRKVFDPGNVKEMLGIATDKLSKYKEMAEFLGSKQAKGEDIVEYFTRIFPVTGSNDKKKKEVSKNAQIAIDILHTQPGAEFAEGSWWQPFNAVTYMTDHLVGRSSDTRLTSAWYGANKGLKTKALELAVEMAEAA